MEDDEEDNSQLQLSHDELDTTEYMDEKRYDLTEHHHQRQEREPEIARDFQQHTTSMHGVQQEAVVLLLAAAAGARS